MLFKKILKASTVVCAAMLGSVAIAGGVDQADQAADVAPSFQSSVYVDAHVGYAQVNWKDFNASGVMGVSGSSYFTPNDNEHGGVTGGADTGYNFTKYIAGEFGWFYLPQVKGAATSVSGLASTETAKISSWFLYAAGKFSVPMVEHISLFGKLGVAYRSLSYTKSVTSVIDLNTMTKDGGYWSPVFAAGMQYLNEGWILGMQYMYLPKNTDHNSAIAQGSIANGGPDNAPEVNLYTAYVGYQFPA